MMEVIDRLTNSKISEKDDGLFVEKRGKGSFDKRGIDRWRDPRIEEISNEEHILDLGDDLSIYADAESSDEDNGCWTVYQPNGTSVELPVRQALEELVQDSEKLDNKTKKDDWECESSDGKSKVPYLRPISHANCIDETGSMSLPCLINNECFNGLVDTGASVNVMPLVIYKRLKLPRYKKYNVVLELANNSKTSSVGIVDNVTVKISDFEYSTSFILVDMVEHPVHQIVIGRRLLKTARALVDFDDDSVTIKSGFRSIMFGNGNLMKDLFQDLVLSLNETGNCDEKEDKHEGTAKKEKPKNKKGRSSFSKK